MRSLVISSMFIMFASGVLCGPKIDSALREKIMAMFTEDQKWRVESIHLQNGKESLFDEETIDKNMGKTDSLNMIGAKLMINKYGFPGYSLVGTDGSNNFWAIIQHCDNDIAFQQKVLLLMAKEVKRHNASGENFAFLQDRVLTNQGRKQLYGTQVRLDLKTHHAKPFPMQDPLNVDLRRKAVGLAPLKEYLKLFDRH